MCLSFPSDYPCRAPIVQFQAPLIEHPFVAQDSQIMSLFITDQWMPNNTARELMEQVWQSLASQMPESQIPDFYTENQDNYYQHQEVEPEQD